MSDTPPELALATIASGLAPFGVRLAETQLLAVQKYVELLLIWNHKVSLTSIGDMAEIVSRHFGESIFAAQILASTSCRLADVGSGAGFPGIPLKIALPTLDVVLIEPNLKKCAFLTEVIGLLGLNGIEVFRGQYSAFRLQAQGSESEFDVICSRALGDYKSLLKWAQLALRPGGRAVLWVGDEDAIQLSRIKGWTWDPPVRVPESRRRAIVVGRHDAAAEITT